MAFMYTAQCASPHAPCPQIRNGLLTVDALRRAVAAEHKAENAKGGLDTVIVACPSRFC